MLASKRNCASIISYYHQILELIWNRFEYLMRQHIYSVTEIDTHKMQALDIRPHYVIFIFYIIIFMLIINI
jgi:hypothetical protein